MKKLNSVRKELDQINNELIRLLIRRFKLLDKVYQIKKAQNIPLHDPERVGIMCRRIAMRVADSKKEDYIIPVFKEIFAESLRYLKNEDHKPSQRRKNSRIRAPKRKRNSR